MVAALLLSRPKKEVIAARDLLSWDSINFEGR